MSSTTETLGHWVGHTLLFSEVLEHDRREPCIVFTLPEFITSAFHSMGEGEEDGGNKFGLVAPRIEFWFALITTLVMGAIFNSLVACVIYKFIVLPQKKSSKDGSNKKKGEEEEQTSIILSPFLVGFGFIMPLCAAAPYYLLRYFYIKSRIIRFLAGIAYLTTFFRCSEAMFGFLPSGVDESLTNLIAYTAFPVEIKLSSGHVMKSTWSQCSRHLINWIKYIFILGLYSSYLQAHDYEIFKKEEGHRLGDIDIRTGFTYRQMMNNLSHAILFQIYLTTFGSGLNFLTSLAGVQQNPMMLNPIFESTSVSDFWGRRWNLVVHGMLKRGVYKPVRTKYSRMAASTATFIFSGVFHEWLLSIVFLPDSDEQAASCTPPTCFRPGYGRNTLFFLWNAILIGFEYAFAGAALFKLVKRNLPVTAVSLLVASTALPVTHWFTNDYVRTDFFKDGQIGFPLIIRVSD